jgi:dihydrofolate reductase
MMTRLTFDITMSVDGFVAGPNQTLEQPLGAGGERLHTWMVGLAAFREVHGQSGGTVNADTEIFEQSVSGTGAILMGRRMFSGGVGPWEGDPNADAWWGDDPPFRVPVFVLTHHARAKVTKENGTTYTFVTDGIEAALEQARAAAGDRNVGIAGGATLVQQYLAAGLVDEFQIHVAPLLLGGGVRLFDESGTAPVEVEATRVVESPGVVHLKYRVVK